MTQHIYMTDEKPGEGTYKCLNCGISLVISYHSDLLPNCPTCSGMEFCTLKTED
ncbi:MAG: zinc ribbon-containing protein [Promethearchaeota archaeon]